MSITALDAKIAGLEVEIRKIAITTGLYFMQTAVLRWAVENSTGLTGDQVRSLLAAMEVEIARPR